MADFQTSVELKAITGQLEAKLAKVQTQLKAVSSQVDKSQGKFKTFSQKASGSLGKLNKKLQESKMMVGALALGIGAAMKKSVESFKEFEDGMAQIGTLGVSGLKQVEKDLDNVRKQFGITGAEATKGYYDIISAGAAQGAQALDRLTAATKLAKAGNTDLAGAVDVVTSGLNVWKQLKPEEVTDKLFLAVKFGKTTVEELGQTFGMVAPIVNTAGGSMDDYAASMATLTAGGIQTRQATTGLSAIMSNLIKVTPKAAKEAERLGLEWGTSGVQANGLVGTIESLQEALANDTSAGTMADKLGKLFDSKEAISSMSVLLQNFEKFKDTQNQMSKAAGTTATALEVVKKSASFSFNMFNEQMAVMSKNIGAAVVPALLEMSSALGPVIEFIADLVAQHPGIIKVTAALTAVGAALTFLGGPVTLAIVATGAALAAILDHFGAFQEGGSAALEKMKLAWDNFLAGFRGADGDFSAANLGKWFGEGLTAALSGIGTFIKDIMVNTNWSDVFSSLWEGLKAVFNGSLDFFSGVFSSIDFSGMANSFIGAIADLGRKIAEIISEAVSSAISSITPDWLGGSSESPKTEGSLNFEKGKTYTTPGGGSLQHFSNGGSVKGAGTGTSDSIPAMLSNGEFVINAKATKKNRALLEWINGNSQIKDMEEVFSMADAFGQGDNFDLFDSVEGDLGSMGSKDLAKIFNANKFSGGGLVGKSNTSNQGSVSSAKSYQFLQFGGEGKFDMEATIAKFTGSLDSSVPAVQAVMHQMEELSRLSGNLSEEEVKNHAYSMRINRDLIKLLPVKKEEAEVTKETVGAVKDLGEVAKTSAMDFKGMGQTLTGDFKNALLNGGDLKSGIKSGLHNMFSSLASKHLDKLMEPLESSVEGWLSESGGIGGLFDSIGGMFSGSSGGGIGGLFDSIGGMFGGSSGGSSGGMMDGIGSFIGGLFNDGGMVPQYLATGGKVQTANGPKGSDTVPAWLTPGEIVLNAGQQANVANAMSGGDVLTGGATYNTYNLEITGNVDQRAIDQIRNVISNSSSQVNSAASHGKRNASGIRR